MVLHPFYSILRAVTYPLFGLDAKFWGVVAMGASVVIIAFLPWLDRSPVKSIRYKGPDLQDRPGDLLFVFFILGYLGVLPRPGPHAGLADLLGDLLRLLPADAVVQQTRQVQTRTGKGELQMKTRVINFIKRFAAVALFAPAVAIPPAPRASTRRR